MAGFGNGFYFTFFLFILLGCMIRMSILDGESDLCPVQMMYVSPRRGNLGCILLLYDLFFLISIKV
jgi:hypothetical protein